MLCLDPVDLEFLFFAPFLELPIMLACAPEENILGHRAARVSFPRFHTKQEMALVVAARPRPRPWLFFALLVDITATRDAGVVKTRLRGEAKPAYNLTKSPVAVEREARKENGPQRNKCDNTAAAVASCRLGLLTAIQANPAITHQILFATPPSATAAPRRVHRPCICGRSYIHGGVGNGAYRVEH